MKRAFLFILLSLVIVVCAACGNADDKAGSIPSDSPSESYQDTADLSKGEEPIQEPNVKALVSSFVTAYNDAATAQISNVTEVNVADKKSGHYRTEFRLGAFSNSYAVTGNIDDVNIDIVGYGWSKDDIRLYADDISLEQAVEIAKVSIPILDKTVSESDIQVALSDMENGDELNGYYCGNVGILWNGDDLMLKVE